MKKHKHVDLPCARSHDVKRRIVRQTATLKPGRYVYDVEITGTSPVETLRVLEGLVTVTPEVTKV